MESVPAQPSGAGCICARHTVASVAAQNGAVRAIVIIAGVVLSAGVANAIECESSPAPSNKNQWAWRLIDNKKCWYAGEPGMDKSKLHWPADADRAVEAGLVSGSVLMSASDASRHSSNNPVSRDPANPIV